MTKMESNPLTGQSIAQWQGLIADRAMGATSSPHQENYANEVRSLMRPFLSGLTAEETWLFQLNVGLFLLRMQTTDRHLGYFARVAASDTIKTIEKHLDSGLTPEIAAKHGERLLETASYIRETTIADAWASPAYLDIYVELWITLASSLPPAESPRLLREELSRLSEAVEAAKSTADGKSRENGGLATGTDNSRDKTGSAKANGVTTVSAKEKTNELFRIVASAWMHYFMDGDQKAWRLLEAADRNRLKPKQLLRFLRLMEENGEWRRLEAWLSHRAIEGVVRNSGSLHEYGRYWDVVIEQLPDAEEQMWSAITSLLPFTDSLYDERLFRFGHWRQWADYHLSLGNDPLNFLANNLKVIEKEAPEVLLPLYHQGVEKNLSLKSRDGYKQAAKQLKRLAKLYGKLKREAQWEAYMETFASRHSRLRTLQGELWKAGLIQ